MLLKSGMAEDQQGFPRQVAAHHSFSACFQILIITETKCVILPVWFLVPSTFSTGIGVFKGFSFICHSRAQLLSMKHPVAPLSSNASTLIGKADPWTSTGTFTSLSMVTNLINSRTSYLVLMLLGLLKTSKGVGRKLSIICFRVIGWALFGSLLWLYRCRYMRRSKVWGTFVFYMLDL